MKNSITILTILFSLLCLTSCDKETILPEQDIPSEIKSYVSNNFSSCSISKATKEKREKNDTYEITLSCGCKLEFNKEKNITDIDCTSKLPDSVVPSSILTYVNSNYPNNYVIGWEIEGNNQNVDINNGSTLVFNLQGDFLHIAD